MFLGSPRWRQQARSGAPVWRSQAHKAPRQLLRGVRLGGRERAALTCLAWVSRGCRSTSARAMSLGQLRSPGQGGGYARSVSRQGPPPARPAPTLNWVTSPDPADLVDDHGRRCVPRVTVGTVSTYRARGQMPPPDQTIGRTHAWRPTTITAWHVARESPQSSA